jgi:chromosome segregation ATPase
MDATKGVELLMGGFANGMNTIIEMRERDARVAAEMAEAHAINGSVNAYNEEVNRKNQAVLNEWREYARGVEQNNQVLRDKVISINETLAEWEAYGNSVAETNKVLREKVLKLRTKVDEWKTYGTTLAAKNKALLEQVAALQAANVKKSS